MGRNAVNVVPASDDRASVKWPPCASAIQRASARPRPAPPSAPSRRVLRRVPTVKALEDVWLHIYRDARPPIADREREPVLRLLELNAHGTASGA